MKTKTYKANTNLSINVVLPSKKSLHISFMPQSDGSSVFTTDNEAIMNAIERHYNFGKLFRLRSSQESVGIPAENLKSERKEDMSDEDGACEENGLRIVKVTDITAAKDYLAETFGISRTSLRTTKSILEQAKANGIEFEGI